MLQLSLDYFLVENYAATPVGHLTDAGVRQGNKQGAICNCNGLWAQGQGGSGEFDDYPAAPLGLQTVMWLGIVTSEMTSNMVFVSSQAILQLFVISRSPLS